jgi:hypothetical protein
MRLENPKIEMGWAAPKIKDQFPQLSDAVANRLQMDSDSITHLSMRGIITPAEKKKALHRFSANVSDALKDVRRAEILNEVKQ